MKEKALGLVKGIMFAVGLTVAVIAAFYPYCVIVG